MSIATDRRNKRTRSRAEKLARAAHLVQAELATPLRRESPSSGTRLNVLFVCSRNQWRSPTAERLWRDSPRLSTRSAGTSPNARHQVSEADLRWADVIVAMEHKHKSRLLADWSHLLPSKPIYVLDIPDDYQYMDPELVDELRRSVAAILGVE